VLPFIGDEGLMALYHGAADPEPGVLCWLAQAREQYQGIVVSDIVGRIGVHSQQYQSLSYITDGQSATERGCDGAYRGRTLGGCVSRTQDGRLQVRTGVKSTTLGCWT
jgi:hypothetical protein